jgi:hypothetical protein
MSNTEIISKLKQKNGLNFKIIDLEDADYGDGTSAKEKLDAKAEQTDLDSTNTTVSAHTTKLATHDTAIAGHDTELATHAQNITDLNTSVGTKADKTALAATNNKIGDLTASGLTETDLASAIKNDRLQLAKIMNSQEIDGGYFGDTTETIIYDGGEF